MPTPTVGTTGEGASTTNAITPTALTTTVDGSWVVGIGTEWQALGNGTSTDTFEAATPTDFSSLAVRKSAVTPTAGTGVTLNFDASGTGTPMWTWAALEVAPSVGGTLAVDASSPVFASIVNAPVTTASFTPPDGALLVCACSADDFSNANPTLTMTSTGLTFTERVRRSGSEGGGATNGIAIIYTAPVVASGARTVSFNTNNANNSLTLKVYVFTEAGAAPTVDAGPDDGAYTGLTFDRLAVENDGGAAVTSRTWEVLSGPAEVGNTISTGQRLFWVPSVTGSYVLRYTATNPIGSAADDVTVTVDAPPAPVFANSPLLRVAPTRRLG